jgi:hypothetical protein|nr:MAG TPA: hypothetical protein [Caudoviricetes sp.]
MNADIFCTLVTTLLAQGISANIFGDGRHRTSVTIVQSLRAQRIQKNKFGDSYYQSCVTKTSVTRHRKYLKFGDSRALIYRRL